MYMESGEGREKQGRIYYYFCGWREGERRNRFENAVVSRFMGALVGSYCVGWIHFRDGRFNFRAKFSLPMLLQEKRMS